jgi:hypothetical protein
MSSRRSGRTKCFAPTGNRALLLSAQSHATQLADVTFSPSSRSRCHFGRVAGMNLAPSGSSLALMVIRTGGAEEH